MDRPHVPLKHTFQIDPVYRSHNLVEQSREVRGRYTEEELVHIAKGKPLKYGQHQFHSPLYRELLMNVVPLRKEYRRVKDLDARKEMAKQEFDFGTATSMPVRQRLLTWRTGERHWKMMWRARRPSRTVSSTILTA